MGARVLPARVADRKSTRLNSSHLGISYAVFCLKKRDGAHRDLHSFPTRRSSDLVYPIPGNHDYAGPGSLWEQEFFRHEWQQLAPNLHLLLKTEPVVLEQAVIFPCPLLRRHEAIDPTTWLRSPNLDLPRFGDKPRMVLAHGSVQGFAALESDEEDAGEGLPNQIDLDRLPGETFDYIALGDWHGAKKV